MPRTLNATLKAALESGSFNAYIQMKWGVNYSDVLKYKLTGTTLEAEVNPMYGSPDTVQLVRGVTIAGVEYSLTTSKFYVIEREVQSFQSTSFDGKFKAQLFPKEYISIAGDDTYENVITAFCTAFGKTAVFDQPSAAIWQANFFPSGKNYTSNNAFSFLNVLAQKYFIYACDYGDEKVLFFQGMADRSADSQYNVWFAEPDPADKDANDIVINTIITVPTQPQSASRTYKARDENASIRTGGATSQIIHNLGYLEAADPFPALSTAPINGQPSTRPFLINLYPLDGDIVTLDPDFFAVTIFPIEVIETYNKKNNPSWSTTIRQKEVLSNTAGGPLPSTIERVAAYTPLVVTNFDGVLSAIDNNLQAAMETIDDHHDNIRYMYPFGSYTTISSFTASPAFPFSSTLPSFTTYIKQYSQAIFTPTTNNASNYWTLELYDAGTTTVIASINTQGLTASTGYTLLDTSMGLSTLTQATHKYLYVRAVKTGAPTALFVHAPAVEYTLG